MRKTAFIPLFFIVILLSCSQEKRVDMIFVNGHIQTVNETLTIAEAMAIKDGKIMAVGTDDQILSQYQAKETRDLQGRYVYPGFIDPHSHFMGYSMNLLRANLWMSGSMEEIVERLKAHQETMIGDWLQGRGWDQNLFMVREMPDNRLLNEAFPDVPVYIIRVDGHAAVANDKALELAEASHNYAQCLTFE